MATVLDRILEQDLDRAHIVTAFFWAGLGAGYRMRQYFDAAHPKLQDTASSLVDSLGLHRDDPFCVGWGYGWEEGKGDG